MQDANYVEEDNWTIISRWIFFWEKKNKQNKTKQEMWPKQGFAFNLYRFEEESFLIKIVLFRKEENKKRCTRGMKNASLL